MAKKADVKVVIIGESGVGKTALMQRFAENKFAKTINTLGVSFMIKEHRGISLAIWDTAGMEQFAPLSAFYCRDASAAVICYDMTDRSTFEKLDKHFDLLSHAKKGCCVVLAGCKYDLVQSGESECQVTSQDARIYAMQKGNVTCYETSSKTNHNVQLVFDYICENLASERLSSPATLTEPSPGSQRPSISSTARSRAATAQTSSSPTPDTGSDGVVRLDQKTESQKKKGCCDG